MFGILKTRDLYPLLGKPRNQQQQHRIHRIPPPPPEHMSKGGRNGEVWRELISRRIGAQLCSTWTSAWRRADKRTSQGHQPEHEMRTNWGPILKPSPHPLSMVWNPNPNKLNPGIWKETALTDSKLLACGEDDIKISKVMCLTHLSLWAEISILRTSSLPPSLFPRSPPV